MSEHVLTPQEIFNQASHNRKSNSGFNHYLQAALEANRWLQFRILGNPKDNRLGDPTSPKSIYVATPKADDDSIFRWYIAPPSDKNHWSRQILNAALEYVWNDKTRERDYIHKDKPFYADVRYNNNPSNPFEQGWNPAERVLMNVIVRDMMDQHFAENRTALLARKMTQKDPNKPGFYDTGMPVSLFNEMWTKIVEHCGPWSDYDVCAKRLEPSAKPWYEIAHATKELWRLQDDIQKGKFRHYPEYAERPLTEQEMGLERYNLDKAFKLTPAATILQKLSMKIGMIDYSLRTHFIDVLRSAVVQETAQAQRDQEQERDEQGAEPGYRPQSYAFPSAPAAPVAPAPITPAPTATQPVAFTPAPAAPVQPAAPAVPEYAAPAPAAVAPPAERPTRPMAPAPQPPVNTVVDIWGTLAANGYKGVALMTQEEKDMAIGLNPDGSIVWDPAAGPVYICSNREECAFHSPMMHVCPQCGKVYDD